ncbi:AbrB/MazE/SpoVT family DNA-binding domain-containing protein [Deinococcus radiophilus]|uniref:AbrB family DNA-binding protein n=2 Tax=Deinococcus radiophilus TaxID=32062 RepID=A0A3S0K8Z3_9DEIO|nr:AbrB/MazE/SpoVT family DNA-binding domain-containing protein [Deinococcus radiophilus]RTR25319.1 AbrB family DNA-binding protein [Deinococcus radiophilus]UFA52058.1 AbrB/MazE/SpoVT family DNA-binding domain-containing protein [Deinococcus radiophilus]
MMNFTVSVREHGRLNLPKRLRMALHLQEQDDLVFRIRADGTAEVVSASILAQQGRGLFGHLKVEESETDAFIAERHAEAGAEG